MLLRMAGWEGSSDYIQLVVHRGCMIEFQGTSSAEGIVLVHTAISFNVTVSDFCG